MVLPFASERGIAMPRDAGSISGARAASEPAEVTERPPKLVLGVSATPMLELVLRLVLELKLVFELMPEPEHPLSNCIVRPRGAVGVRHGSEPLPNTPKERWSGVLGTGPDLGVADREGSCPLCSSFVLSNLARRALKAFLGRLVALAIMRLCHL